MRTIAIKMKNYAGVVRVASDGREGTILNVLLGSIGMLAVLYVFLLGSMVFNIVERKALETQARGLSNEVSDLELTYLATSNKVDMTLSHSMGFKEVKATFATRKALSSLGNTKLAENGI